MKTPDSDERHIDVAVRRAQQHAREHGIEIGAAISDSIGDLRYMLESVDGDQATALIPANPTRGTQAVRKTLPVGEIFDLELVEVFAFEEKSGTPEIKRRHNAPNN